MPHFRTWDNIYYDYHGTLEGEPAQPEGFAATGPTVPPVALLLPAVQAAREAAPKAEALDEAFDFITSEDTVEPAPYVLEPAIVVSYDVHGAVADDTLPGAESDDLVEVFVDSFDFFA